MKIDRVVVEKGISRSKGPDGPWEKVSYQVEATLEFESELDPAREKLERILDQWLALTPSPPGPQAPAAQPAPSPSALGREPVARIRLADKEVALVFPDHVEISAPLSTEDPATKNFFVPRFLKELGIPYELRLKGDLLVGVAFKADLTENQVKGLTRALSWTLDKATSRGT